MFARKWMIVVLIIFLALAFIWGISYWFGGPDSDQDRILEGTGIYVGQIDSQSVEIEFGGQARAFAVGEGVSLTGIGDGSTVIFSYAEGKTRPVLLSIEAVAVEGEILHGEGIFTGQIDSHSVEIFFDNQPQAFALSDQISLVGIEDGSPVAFTYRNEENRPLLLSIKLTDRPVGGSNGDLVGEGILQGQIDAQSVEILLNRVFMLGDGVSVEGIDDGSLVAFTYSVSGPRAVLRTLEKVDEPVEGDLVHGIFVGQSDSQSVEIEYYMAFALGAGVGIEGIADGAEVIFTFQEGTHRPVLTSIMQK